MTPHMDVGVYLLGVLDDSEMAKFEAHLAECEQCGRELDELSGLLPILSEIRDDGIGYEEPPSGEAMLDRLLDQVRRERKARRRRRLLLTAVAAVLVVGGPAVAVHDYVGGSPAPAPAFARDRHTASNPATGASAEVGVADKGWGSVVDLRLSGVRGPLTCSLIAVGQDGSWQTVATWSVPDTGYGTDAQPHPLTVQGASGFHKDAISHFDVRANNGKLLVSVPT